MSIVCYELSGKVATIGMDDGKANALSPVLLEELNRALDRAEQDAAVVILSGREGMFSGGFDLSVIGQGNEVSLGLARAGSELSRRLLAFPAPVIAASRGHAVAMGAFLLLSCDYRIGVEGEFRYGLNEVAIGMTMPYTGVELARARLNQRYVDRSVNNAEMYAPATAVEAGFLDQVVSPAEFQPALQEMAEKLSALDLNAHKQTKLKSRSELYQKLDVAMEKDFQDFKSLFGLS